MYGLCMKKYVSFFMEVQNNPYTFLNLRHLNTHYEKLNLKLKENKLEHVQATKRDPNFSILKIDYSKN